MKKLDFEISEFDRILKIRKLTNPSGKEVDFTNFYVGIIDDDDKLADPCEDNLYVYLMGPNCMCYAYASDDTCNSVTNAYNELITDPEDPWYQPFYIVLAENNRTYYIYEW